MKRPGSKYLIYVRNVIWMSIKLRLYALPKPTCPKILNFSCLLHGIHATFFYTWNSTHSIILNTRKLTVPKKNYPKKVTFYFYIYIIECTLVTFCCLIKRLVRYYCYTNMQNFLFLFRIFSFDIFCLYWSEIGGTFTFVWI